MPDRQRRGPHPAGAAAVLVLFAGGACQTTPVPPPEPMLTPEAAASAAAVRLPLSICRPPGLAGPVLCGVLEVPEDRSKPRGRQIGLRVVVVPALAPHPEAEPWFDIEGGPSDSATALAAEYEGELARFRARRDVVLVDQRGTGDSRPLACPALDDPEDPLMPKLHLPAVKACAETLKERADLTQYTTEAAVADLEAVRAWLGYPRVHLYGYSYGTLVAQTYLRRHPDRVATATLWGPVSPRFRRPLHFARDTEAALGRLFAACRDAPPQADGRRCGARFPDPMETAKSVLRRLEIAPVRVVWRRPERLPVKVVLTRQIFGEGLGALAYDTEAARIIPWMVYQAAIGDFEPFVDAVNRRGRLRIREQTGMMYLAVTCAEETARIGPADRDPGDADTVFGRRRLEEQMAACRHIPPAEIPSDFYDPLPAELAVPVVIFSGSFDPVTPPRWGEAVAASIPGARLLTIEGMGHTVDGMSDPRCPDRIANALAETGTFEGIDLGCVNEMRPPPFYLGRLGT